MGIIEMLYNIPDGLGVFELGLEAFIEIGLNEIGLKLRLEKLCTSGDENGLLGMIFMLKLDTKGIRVEPDIKFEFKISAAEVRVTILGTIVVGHVVVILLKFEKLGILVVTVGIDSIVKFALVVWDSKPGEGAKISLSISLVVTSSSENDLAIKK
jgi:hypothetical protein